MTYGSLLTVRITLNRVRHRLYSVHDLRVTMTLSNVYTRVGKMRPRTLTKPKSLATRESKTYETGRRHWVRIKIDTAVG